VDACRFKQIVWAIRLREADHSDAYTHKTATWARDDNNRVSFYGDKIRVVDCTGKEVCKFTSQQYLEFVAEHVERELHEVHLPEKARLAGFRRRTGVEHLLGWPARPLNAADAWPHPRPRSPIMNLPGARGKPVHQHLANHWARVIEMIQAAERIEQLVADPEIVSPTCVACRRPCEGGMGVVEAPRGTLFHHYQPTNAV